jgi:hypothetical protein
MSEVPLHSPSPEPVDDLRLKSLYVFIPAVNLFFLLAMMMDKLTNLCGI